MNGYRKKILELFTEILEPIGPLQSGLDFGSGDGWFSLQFQDLNLCKKVTAIDTKRRDKTLFEPTLYRGDKLPFPDRSFDLTYSVDVLHHCEDPERAIGDLLRCSSQYVLIKDHSYRTRAGFMTLQVLDEIGNRRFGIPSNYRYQKEWSWLDTIEHAGFQRVSFVHPANVHRGLLGALTNPLQFVGLWQRI